LKALAVRCFNLQRTHLAFVFAFARHVADHRRFGVIFFAGELRFGNNVGAGNVGEQCACRDR
jgi:hypothetical protein